MTSDIAGMLHEYFLPRSSRRPGAVRGGRANNDGDDDDDDGNDDSDDGDGDLSSWARGVAGGLKGDVGSGAEGSGGVGDVKGPGAGGARVEESGHDTAAAALLLGDVAVKTKKKRKDATQQLFDGASSVPSTSTGPRGYGDVGADVGSDGADNESSSSVASLSVISSDVRNGEKRHVTTNIGTSKVSAKGRASASRVLVNNVPDSSKAVEYVFFKRVRIGDLHVQLSASGFRVIGSLRAWEAQITSLLFLRKLYSWRQLALKIKRMYISQVGIFIHSFVRSFV